jgi:hypothetical protein
MSDEKYYIYPSHWWPGFIEKRDANHIGFFELLFLRTKLRNFEITNDINKANVLLDSGKPDDTIRNYKKWKYKFNFVGEPVLPDADKYDVVLTSVNNVQNIVDLPLVIMYIHCNNFLPRLINRPTITRIPDNFCSFIVTNHKCQTRNKMFELLNKYKKVNSMGRFANNVGYTLDYPYWSNNYLDVIGNHKFMICFENTKMETYSTEKIANPYIARTIPIYWGTHNIKNIFNPDSMLFLEDETDESFEKLINRVIELDNDNEKYLEFIYRPIFTKDNIKFWDKNYMLDSIGRKIDKII